MFQVFLTGNNSEYFTLSPTAVQGRAVITMRVAVPLDYERIRSYSFSVSFHRAASVCVRVRERKREGGGAVRLSGWKKFFDILKVINISSIRKSFCNFLKEFTQSSHPLKVYKNSFAHQTLSRWRQHVENELEQQVLLHWS